MSDHIKVLAEMFGMSVDVMRITIAAKEQEKSICDLFGVKSLSELEQLKKTAEQAAALKWLGSRAAISGLYHSPAQLAEPAANERASDIGRPAKPPEKRCNLISDLTREWPTIDNDLREASRNGLDVARVTTKKGYWDRGRALAWAAQNHRLKTPRSNTMENLPSRKFTTK